MDPREFRPTRAGTRRRGYTLLELVLSLALTTVILGLVAMAIHNHLMLAEGSRGRVEEAQLARDLLLRIAEDLRNAAPFVASSSSSSSSSSKSSSSSSSSTSSTSSSSSSTSSSSNPSSTSSSSSGASSSGTPNWAGTTYLGGIYGSTQTLQMEISHHTRVNTLAGVQNNSQIPSAGDIKVVIYSLGQPGTGDPTASGSGSTQGGLYRREVDRAAFVWAHQKSGSSDLSQATELLSPEVTDLAFIYYDSTIASNEWDSTENEKLPCAVRVSLAIRHSASGSSEQGARDATRKPVTYSMLVALPNAKASNIAPSSTSNSSSTSTSSSITKSSSQ